LVRQRDGTWEADGVGTPAVFIGGTKSEGLGALAR
jgi:hypothetical protein